MTMSSGRSHSKSNLLMRALVVLHLVLLSPWTNSRTAAQDVDQKQSEARVVKTVERHLIIMGCGDAYWGRMKRVLEGRVDFTSTTCVSSEDDEARATEKLRQRAIEAYGIDTSSTEEQVLQQLSIQEEEPLEGVLDVQPMAPILPVIPESVIEARRNSNIDIHVVAALITSNMCREGANCRPVNYGENYIPLLRAGVTGWFLEAEPDFERLGIQNRTLHDIRSTELSPDNSHGGNQVGQEFCRIASTIAPATIALVYGPKEAAHSTQRMDAFKDALQEYCPEAQHEIKYSFHADWSSHKAAAILSPLFLRDGKVDAIICANDHMALGALIAAREMRPYKHLLVAGYDANTFTIPLLQSGELFATVDQLPPTGIGYSLEVMLSDSANGGMDFGPPTFCANTPGPQCRLEDYNTIQQSAWDNLRNSMPQKSTTAVAIRVKDPSALVLRNLLLLYNRANRPPSVASLPTPVRAQLLDMRLFELYTQEASILAQAVLVLTWQDTRLSWSPKMHPEVGSINLPDINEIWSPVVLLSNLLKTGFSTPFTNIQSTLYPNGTVVWEQMINTGEFGCGEIEQNVFQFPFDTQNCGIDLTSYSVKDVELYSSPPEDFSVEVANNDWRQGPDTITHIYQPDQYQTILYRVEMSRDPLFTQLSIIVPSFLLNTISFAQHWIPTRTDSINLDRGGMAITTILAALALRDTMVAEVGNAFTYLDLFLLVSLVFQFIGFLITTYESSSGQTKKGKEQEHLGLGDRLGKVIIPIVFGLFCTVLSLVWAGKPWILFYLSVLLILLTVYLGRKERQRFNQRMKEKLERRRARSIRRKLGKSTASSDDGMSPESIVRYMRWQALKSQALKEQGGTTTTGSALDSNVHHSEEMVCSAASRADRAAKILQRSFRNHIRDRPQTLSRQTGFRGGQLDISISEQDQQMTSIRRGGPGGSADNSVVTFSDEIDVIEEEEEASLPSSSNFDLLDSSSSSSSGDEDVEAALDQTSKTTNRTQKKKKKKKEKEKDVDRRSLWMNQK